MQMKLHIVAKNTCMCSVLLCMGPNTPLHTQVAVSPVLLPVGLILCNHSFSNFWLCGGKWMVPCFHKLSISIMGNVSGVFVTILLHQAQIACRDVWEVAMEKGVMMDWHRIWHGFCAFEVWESLYNALQRLCIQQKQTTRKSGRVTVPITMCCGRSSSIFVSAAEQLAGWYAGRRRPRESAVPMLGSSGCIS